MLPSYADRQRGEKKRYLPSGVIGMGHNAPFNIVCMNFINIGRDGIIVKQIFAAYERAHLTDAAGWAWCSRVRRHSRFPFTKT